MVFTKKLRPLVRNGDITTSIRIWQKPRVKTGGRYQFEDGYIVIKSIQEITLADISETMARDSGFENKLDLLKTAKHGSGHKVFFIRFKFERE